MLNLNVVTIVTLSSTYAEAFTGMINRIVWRDEWEIERVSDVEKKIKDGKYQSFKSPLLLVRRNTDEAFLGYIKFVSGDFGIRSFKIYADPKHDFDPEAWFEAVCYTRDFFALERELDRHSVYSVPNYDPLPPVYERAGYKLIGIEPKSKFVQGELIDQALYEYIRETPYPTTRVKIEELSGAGGRPPDWRTYRGGDNESP